MAIAEIELATPVASFYVASVNREVFASALADVCKITHKGYGHPVLSGVRLESCSTTGTLTLTATDLEIQVARTIPADVPAAGWGVVIVPAKGLKDMIAKLGKGANVSMSIIGTDLSVSAGARSFTLTTFTVEDWPNVVHTPVLGSLVASGADVCSAFTAAVIPASTDEVRPTLTGVLFHESDGLVQLVSTDSYRLGIVPLPLYRSTGELSRKSQYSRSYTKEVRPVEMVEPIVPARALKMFAGWAKGAKTVCISFGESQATLSVDGLSMTTRLLEGEFPKYRQLVPDYTDRLKVDAAALKAGIDFAAAMAGTNTPVRFSVSGERLTLSTTEAGTGGATEVVECANYAGIEIQTAFNGKYLADSLAFLGSAQVEIGLRDALKPAVLTGNGRTYIAMPVRLSR